jgi:hypothetical protein
MPPTQVRPANVRSPRFKYRHTPFAAAQVLGIPQSWIWYWIATKRIRGRPGPGQRYVRLEHLENLLRSDWAAIEGAFEHTQEPITCPERTYLLHEDLPTLAQKVCVSGADPGKPTCRHVPNETVEALLQGLRSLETELSQ